MYSTHLNLEPADSGSVKQSDLKLVMALRAGSDTAFAELHRLYAHPLYRRILAITKNHEDAEDVLQETLMRAYLGLDSFEGRSKLQSWLTRIAINCSLMTLRKRRVRREAAVDTLSIGNDEVPPLEVKDPNPNPEEFYLHHEGKMRFAKAMAGLKPSLRSAIEIRLGTEGSMEEIARSLGVSVAAVKARLHRARKYVATRTGHAGSTFASRKATPMQVSLG